MSVALTVLSPSRTQHTQVGEHAAACAAFVRGEAEPAENENDAAWLLRFYNTFLADANAYDVIQAALGALARLRGNFAFVLYDAGVCASMAMPLHSCGSVAVWQPCCLPRARALTFTEATKSITMAHSDVGHQAVCPCQQARRDGGANCSAENVSETQCCAACWHRVIVTPCNRCIGASPPTNASW